MTIMIPNNCVDVCPIAQALYKNLNKQLGTDDRVVQHLSSKTGLPGALFWVQHKRQSLFIYLANSRESDINIDGFDSESDEKQLNSLVENKEVSKLLLLQRQLLPEMMHKYRSKLAPFLIINPYANDGDKHFVIKSLGLFFFGNKLIKSQNLGSLVYKLMGISGSSLLHQHIRFIFNPELIIHDSSSHSESAKDQKMLLDENQELAMKSDIVLQNKDYRIDNYNLTSVSGFVSSGKTETLISRAELLTQLNPESKVVIITANYASQAFVRECCNIFDADNLIGIFSFEEWCKQQLKPSKHLIEDAELMGLIEVQLKKHLEDNAISKFVFLRELDFIYGREIFYERDYLASQDVLRPYALSSEQFNHIWRAILTLKNESSLRSWLLPARIPQLLLDKLQETSVRTIYDHILVDDADLLPPIAFELFKKLIKPESGQLFVSQNANQQIVSDNQLWKDVKLDVTEHNIDLLNRYQINPAILNASKDFSLNRMPDTVGDELQLEGVEDSKEAPFPRLLHFLSETDERNRLLNEIKELVFTGCEPQEILIICNDNEINHLTKLIAETLNISVDYLNDFHFTSHQKRNGLGICSYLQAQGLKASYVFVFGLKQLFDKEIREEEIDTGQLQAKQLENTRLITMAMTRARQELTLFIATEEIPKAFLSPYIKNPTNIGDDGSESVVSYIRKSG